ncbi:HigA family addiction module antidote protein [Salmonella enterica]|nr:HigA family addiction module antidote protein [Salmonella enterica]
MTRKASTPADILVAEYMEPLNLSVATLATKLKVPVNIARNLVQDKIEVTPELAEKLAKAFNTSSEFWMNLQKNSEATQ